MFAGFGWTQLSAHAADTASANAPKIQTLLGEKAILATDGTLYLDFNSEPYYQNLNLVDVSGYNLRGYGLTRDGHIVSWDYTPPAIVPGIDHVAQITKDNYLLKTDGTVWDWNSQIKNVSDVIAIDAQNEGAAAITKNGDAFMFNASGPFAKVNVPGAVAVKANEYVYAVLDKNGDVTLVNTQSLYTMEDIVPYKVASDVKAMGWSPDDTLYITKKDGTVWKGAIHKFDYKNQTFEFKPVQGIQHVVQTKILGEDLFYAHLENGDWVLYDDGQLTTMEVPHVDKLTFTLEETTLYTGDKVAASITEVYSTGVKIKRSLGKVNVKIDKPNVLQALSTGQIKAVGVGEANVTVTSGGKSSTVKVIVHYGDRLQGATNVKGVIYLPVKPVFTTIGGTVSYDAATKKFNIAVGSTKIVLQKGSAAATVNGKAVSLNAPVQTAGNGETLFPSGLLVKALGAKLEWNKSWEEMYIYLGKGELTVVSANTLKYEKSELLGNLENLIGKTVWVNYFQDWQRFMKLTITDIVLDERTDDFIIVFKNAKGQTFKSYPYGKSDIAAKFQDTYFFFPYDPVKHYKWSQNTWNLIKAEKVAIGMTKEQVIMSWGETRYQSTLQSGGLTIESWSYSSGYSFIVITFTNGKVTQILS